MIKIRFRHEKWCFLEAVWIEEGEAVVEVVVEAVVEAVVEVVVEADVEAVVAVAKGCEVDGRFGVELNVREFPV